jgi:hypothetical protein
LERLERRDVPDGYTSALPCAEIAAQLPGRGATSVAARARRLGLGSYARRWRDGEDQRLVVLVASGDTLADVAQQLGRTPEAMLRSVRLGSRAQVSGAPGI